MRASRPPSQSEIDALNARLRQRPETDIVRASFIPHDNIVRANHPIIAPADASSPIPLPVPAPTPEPEPVAILSQPHPRILANITKVVDFEDPIIMTTEKIHVGRYILEDPDNVVIVYGDNKYFFTKREYMYNQMHDATVYPCKTKGAPLEHIFENVDDHVINKPLYDLKKIGLIVPFCDIMVFFENPQVQLFGLINDTQNYPSFISKNCIDGHCGYGALHCQDGQESYITRMVVAVPSTTDNGRRIRRRTRSRSQSRDPNVTRRRRR